MHPWNHQQQLIKECTRCECPLDRSGKEKIYKNEIWPSTILYAWWWKLLWYRQNDFWLYRHWIRKPYGWVKSGGERLSQGAMHFKYTLASYPRWLFWPTSKPRFLKGTALLNATLRQPPNIQFISRYINTEAKEKYSRPQQEPTD